MCESGRRRVTRLEPNGELTVLADNYEGKRFNSPNDLAIDKQGRIYFSDPRYGRRDDMEVPEAVYRIDGAFQSDTSSRRPRDRSPKRAPGLARQQVSVRRGQQQQHDRAVRASYCGLVSVRTALWMRRRVDRDIRLEIGPGAGRFGCGPRRQFVCCRRQEQPECK